MLDMYDFRNDVWLCHSYGGICQNFTAFVSSSSSSFQPASTHRVRLHTHTALSD